MKLEQFEKEYGLKFTKSKRGRDIVATTEVYRKSDNRRIGGVQSTFDFYETDTKLQDSKTVASLFEWDWDKLIEEARRAQLDHFALVIPIEDFYPRDKDVDIESLYI